MSNRRAKRLCAAIAFCAIVCAGVLPAEAGTVLSRHDALSLDPLRCETASCIAAPSTPLADVGRQLLDPANCPHFLGNEANAWMRTLPAPPATVVLTMFGFFCVALSRDWRTLLAVASLFTVQTARRTPQAFRSPVLCSDYRTGAAAPCSVAHESPTQHRSAAAPSFVPSAWAAPAIPWQDPHIKCPAHTTGRLLVFVSTFPLTLSSRGPPC